MFAPWKGPAYGSPGNILGGRRLLVVLESHYAVGDKHPIGTCEPDFTNDVIRQYLEGGFGIRTFDKIAAAIAGKLERAMTREDMTAFWNSIAFYNYVPVFIAHGPRQERPTEDMYARGADPFRQVMSDLRPDAVVVGGHGVWDYVVFHHADPSHHKKTDPDFPFVSLSDVGGIWALKMLHPSTGFSPPEWGARIRQLLELPRSPTG